MTKKRYIKPSTDTIWLHHQLGLLAGSVDSVTSSGLDDNEAFDIITDPVSGENAW